MKDKNDSKLPAPPMWDINATSMQRCVTAIKKADSRSVEPRVIYTTKAWQSIRYLVDTCKDEVGWWGLVECLANNDYLIKDIFVPRQEVSGATTEIEHDALAELTYELIERQLDPSELVFWGHSHVNMGVSPSGQDERQTAEYIEHCPVFIRGIYNKKREAKVDLFLRDQGLVYQCVENIPIHDLIDDETADQLDAAIRTNVKQRVYIYNNNFNNRAATVTQTPAKSQFKSFNNYDDYNDYPGLLTNFRD